MVRALSAKLLILLVRVWQEFHNFSTSRHHFGKTRDIEMPPRRRRPRPSVIKFDADRLCDAWDSIASLREPGFAWDGASYTVSWRSAPDERGLEQHYDALLPLLKEARTGFPSHLTLEAALLKLHERHGILLVEQRFASRAANLGAEQWRLMCKHVYSLVVSFASVQSEKVRELCGCIVIKDAISDAPSSELLTEDAPAISDVAAGAGPTVHHESEDEVVLCSWRCQCDACKNSPAYVDLVSECGSSPACLEVAMEDHLHEMDFAGAAADANYHEHVPEQADGLTQETMHDKQLDGPTQETMQDKHLDGSSHEKELDELLRVASPALGGQRKETDLARDSADANKRTRKRTKTQDPQAASKTGLKKPRLAATSPKKPRLAATGPKKRGRLAATSAGPKILDATHPVAVVSRRASHTRGAEAYIMVGKTYVGSLSAAQSPAYLEKVKAVADAIRVARVTTIEGARQELALARSC